MSSLSSTTPEIQHTLIGFARKLRAAGLTVGTDRIAGYCRAASVLDITILVNLYWIGRTCLLSSRDDIEAYDSTFSEYFLDFSPETDRLEDPIEDISESQPNTTDDDHSNETFESTSLDSLADLESPDRSDDETESAEIGFQASLNETLKSRSFSEWSDSELELLPELISELSLLVPSIQIRRSRIIADGSTLDLRQTIRRSLRHDGELFDRRWRTKRYRPRDVVMLLDVSGSMATHTRALLHFGYALRRSSVNTEVLCFGTRLTRVSELLDDRDPNQAVLQAAAQVNDWDGGTRMGECLQQFLTEWSRLSYLRGALVLLFSDGLERGDPAVLATQVERLSLLAYRLVWMNPLKADPVYEPLARGMAAALPHIDHFLPADSITDLKQVTYLIARLAHTVTH